MPLLDAIVGPLGKLIDKIIPDPRARDAAKLELLKLQGNQEAAQIAQQMQAIIAEANSHDPWTSRARPSFLYVMYALMLWSVPMGLIAAVDPSKANAIAVGMTSYLRALPDEHPLRYRLSRLHRRPHLGKGQGRRALTRSPVAPAE
jgi:hypothetical protein